VKPDPSKMLKLKALLARSGDGDDSSQDMPHPLELGALLMRAAKGDESTLPFIRELLDLYPSMGDKYGAEQAEQLVVNAISGKNTVQREALDRKRKQLRDELLGGPNPQPLERLLVERVVLCWLHAHFADVQYGLAASISRIEQGDYLQRQQDRAQWRYLAAIKCLATVRRLALPVKLDVTVAGAVESQARAACRRPVEAGPAGTSEFGHDPVTRNSVHNNRGGRRQTGFVDAGSLEN
jgi:hypothetical protein